MSSNLQLILSAGPYAFPANRTPAPCPMPGLWRISSSVFQEVANLLEILSHDLEKYPSHPDLETHPLGSAWPLFLLCLIFVFISIPF